MRLDAQAGNTQWQDATALEMAQLHEYDTSRTVVIEVIPRKDTRRFALIWYLTASMMVDTKPGWSQMVT